MDSLGRSLSLPHLKEIYTTKATYLGKGLYGCRVFNKETGKWLCEARVKKRGIQLAFKELLRTLDKSGSMSPMAYASRHRTIKENDVKQPVFYILWNKGI
jgi:hypothetical protein